jgi:hypothetical protein
MYFTGKEGRPSGDNFSFYAEWVSPEKPFVRKDDGFLIEVTTATGRHQLWVTEETMDELIKHDPSVIRIPLLAASAELQLEPVRPLAALFQEDNPEFGPQEEPIEGLKRYWTTLQGDGQKPE